MSRNSTGSIIASPHNGIGTREELQERWKRLELKPATLLHLQEVLDISGVAAAATITEVMVKQKAKRVRFTDIGKEWGSEALRLLSLEGMRPHLIDVIRVVLESLLAWHVFSLPALSEGARDTVVEIVLSVLFLLVSLLGMYLLCQFRRTFSGVQQRKIRS